eukprot:scaffold96936_cov69-Phaeocystis_antarctica.AAC.2
MVGAAALLDIAVHSEAGAWTCRGAGGVRLRLVDARVMVELGLAWLQLRLTEGSVLLAMGEPMGNDSVMSELSCACTIFSQPNNYWERRPEYVAFAPLYARRRRSSAVYPPLSAEFFIETLFAV